jgi:heparan-alpha-glucosaminide N-acetyltransferase
MSDDKPQRLMSLDVYRGFVMLLMASSGLRLASVAASVRGVDGTWQSLIWDSIAYQTSHVVWTGCSLWDLIQPSFMFMVGVSMPFSLARRQEQGHSAAKNFCHAVWRAMVLVGLGVLLTSSVDQIKFLFTNVLAQIGLGYVFLFLAYQLCGQSLKKLTAAAAVVLVGYGAWFVFQPIDSDEVAATQKVILVEKPQLDATEWTQFQGHAAHWNKHTNAAAQVDRALLNELPRYEESGRFWFNRGGYQTLNFIPSLATMIFGLMAGVVMRSDRDDGQRLKWLFKAGLVCFGVSMLADTTLWPTQWLSAGLQSTVYEYSWSICPAVKRIWSPTWAVFAAGWTFWMLGAFYWLVDVKGYKKIVFPFAVVGINSIAMYCMAQLIKGWLGAATKVIFRTCDQMTGTGIMEWFNSNPYSPVADYALRLAIMWWICYWMYRNRLFIRI